MTTRPADDLKSYAERAAEVRARKPVEEFVAALTEMPGQVPTTHLFHRGDHTQPKAAIEPGGLTILDSASAETARNRPPCRRPAGGWRSPNG